METITIKVERQTPVGLLTGIRPVDPFLYDLAKNPGAFLEVEIKDLRREIDEEFTRRMTAGPIGELP